MNTMKRYIYSLLLAVPLLALQSCINDELDVAYDETDNDYISITVSTGKLQTRTMADNELESAVNHLDVVIFEKSGEYKYSERINVTPSSEGTVRLGVKRSGFFDKDADYFVYVIANSTHPAATFADLEDRDALSALDQADERIHITGSSVDGAPSSFLMDGVAFLKGNAEPALPEAIVLYNGVDKDKTQLKVNLRRAAAKIEVELISGNEVAFVKNAHVGYYLRNMPYTTKVIPLEPTELPHPELRTPDKTTGRYFSWIANEPADGVSVANPDTVKVTAYVYSHAWGNSEFFTRGTSLIVNIPVRFAGDVYNNSYYQIALRPKTALNFKRNNYYKVTGTINAPGAEEESVPIEVSDLHYTVREWEEVDVDVNGANAPVYLTVNRDTIKMFNVAKDAETLMFSSSSNVSVSLISNNNNYPYYIDKFGKKQRYSGGGIGGNATGISGNITVNSPVPTNNTVRYFMLEVSNAEGLKDTVWVEQYPLIYVTNQQGWYSYRDDFRKGNGRVTTYEQKGDGRYVAVGLPSGTWNGNYSYTDTPSMQYWGDTSVNSDYFWHSKYVSYYNESTGKSTTSLYAWGESDSSPNNAVVCETGTNARMYHIRVTATSDKYKVGRPRMTADGYTDPGDDNARLVSPSFMIASRLGAIYSSYGNLSSVTDFKNEGRDKYKVDDTTKEITGTIIDNNRNGVSDRLEILREHCKNYVEVYKDENGKAVVLDDWRVPTRAEIDIIISLQGSKNSNADAIDYLLNGYYYMSASGPAYNSQGDNNNTNTSAIRCVRDAYVK